MTVTIRRTGQAILNEDLPVAITDAAELSVYDIASLAAWYRGRHATMRGVATQRPFRWVDRRRLVEAAPAAAKAPRSVASGAVQYLALGYSGDLTAADNGSLQTPDGNALFTGNSLTLAVLARTPVVGGVAGANPGGWLAGSKREQSPTYNTTQARAWGVSIGVASLPGRPRMAARGDTQYAAASTSVDHRDGLWHVYVGIVDDAARTVAIRIDGAQVASASLGSQTISALDGARELRIGATGAPGATAPEYQYAGDIREVLLFGAALAGADLATVEGWLTVQAAG